MNPPPPTPAEDPLNLQTCVLQTLAILDKRIDELIDLRADLAGTFEITSPPPATREPPTDSP